MIELFDKVKIKKIGVIGIVLDIRKVNGAARYTVESDEKELKEGAGGYPRRWPQYDCVENELEKL